MSDLGTRFAAALNETLESGIDGEISLERFIKDRFDEITQLREQGFRWGFIGRVIRNAKIRFRGDVEPTNKALSDAYRAVKKRLNRAPAQVTAPQDKQNEVASAEAAPQADAETKVEQPVQSERSECGADVQHEPKEMPPLKKDAQELQKLILEGAARKKRLNDI